MSRKQLQKIAYELGYGDIYKDDAVLFNDDYRWHICYRGSFICAVGGMTQTIYMKD